MRFIHKLALLIGYQLIYVVVTIMVMLFPLTLPDTWANQNSLTYYVVMMALLWLLSFMFVDGEP